MLQEVYLTEEELSYIMPDEVPLPFVEDPEPASIMVLATSQLGPSLIPSNTIIVEDPINQYYKTLREGESPDPDQIIIAKESSYLDPSSPSSTTRISIGLDRLSKRRSSSSGSSSASALSLSEFMLWSASDERESSYPECGNL
jgi:hypothetical protein